MSTTQTKIDVSITSRWQAVEMVTTVTSWETDSRGNRVHPERRHELPKIDLLVEPKRARKIAKALGLEEELRTLFGHHLAEAREAARDAEEREVKNAEQHARSRVQAQRRAAELEDAAAVWA